MICAYCGRVAHRCTCARPDSALQQFFARRSAAFPFTPLYRAQPYKRAVPPQIKKQQRDLLRRHARNWYAELVQQYGESCANCGALPPDHSLVLDHVVPIARGGCSELANLQLLCAVCNRIKGKLVIDCRTLRYD
jgi:5-methylcytosine-specific restriction endonuclease McrA